MKKEIYTTLEIEVIEIAAEQGFAGSHTGASAESLPNNDDF